MSIANPAPAHPHAARVHLAPSRGWVSLRLGELWEYHELLYFLIWRDVKVRYKQTVLGAGWAIIQPLFTMLVFTVGQGVHGFTLEPSIGEYLLSNENIRIPSRGKVYSVNEGNYHRWPAGTQRYLDYLKVQDKPTGRPYTGRYSGCLVADVHRILLGGGIYLYPGEKDKPEGKLRLMYEGNPLAMVVEQAGGKATTGTMRILDVEPKALHQRIPLIIGSAEDVSLAEDYVQGRA